MNKIGEMVIVASVCLLIGIPLWTAIFAPSSFSTMMIFDPGFWIAVVAGVTMVVVGFGIGQRTGLGE